MTMPFYLLAFADRTRDSRAVAAGSKSKLPLVVGSLVAGTFALILGMQSITWSRLTRHLMRDVESYPQAAVPWRQVAWNRDTPLYHWGTACYVFVLEGRTAEASAA